MVLSNVIVDVTISCRSFEFGQSHAKVSAGSPNDFHEYLNRQEEDIEFTKEIEQIGKITFLDCLVTRDDNI